eukprot:GHVN01106031.1.p1 GENE.GHVN01106031.1~~GHVN01106031.1.p1  ORF type:complete len:835 (-),score=117.72 GHVN01106031.1:255-2759(-)
MSDDEGPKTKIRQNQKPRHVPSFVVVKDDPIERLARSFATPEQTQDIMEHYEFGTIGLRRYAVTHQEEVDGYIEDFSKRSTRLTNDATDRTVVTVGFSGRKKRWTLCPSSDCIPKADKREKIVGQWKFLHLPPKGDELVVPKCVHEAYSEVVDDCCYFAATLCPQQTYCAKHSSQPGFINREWHAEHRHVHALADFLVFCDNMQKVRAVWRLVSVSQKYAGGPETAETNLINVMTKVLHHYRDRTSRSQSMNCVDPERPLGIEDYDLCLKNQSLNMCITGQNRMMKSMSPEELHQMGLNSQVMVPCHSMHQQAVGAHHQMGARGGMIVDQLQMPFGYASEHHTSLQNQLQQSGSLHVSTHPLQNGFQGQLVLNRPQFGFVPPGSLSPSMSTGSGQSVNHPHFQFHQHPQMMLMESVLPRISQQPGGEQWIFRHPQSPNRNPTQLIQHHGEHQSGTTSAQHEVLHCTSTMSSEMSPSSHQHHHVHPHHNLSYHGKCEAGNEESQDPHYLDQLKLDPSLKLEGSIKSEKIDKLESDNQQTQQHHLQVAAHQLGGSPNTLHSGLLPVCTTDHNGQQAVVMVNCFTQNGTQHILQATGTGSSPTDQYVLSGTQQELGIGSSSPEQTILEEAPELEARTVQLGGIMGPGDNSHIVDEHLTDDSGHPLNQIPSLTSHNELHDPSIKPEVNHPYHQQAHCDGDVGLAESQNGAQTPQYSVDVGAPQERAVMLSSPGLEEHQVVGEATEWMSRKRQRDDLVGVDPNNVPEAHEDGNSFDGQPSMIDMSTPPHLDEGGAPLLEEGMMSPLKQQRFSQSNFVTVFQKKPVFLNRFCQIRSKPFD